MTGLLLDDLGLASASGPSSDPLAGLGPLKNTLLTYFSLLDRLASGRQLLISGSDNWNE